MTVGHPKTTIRQMGDEKEGDSLATVKVDPSGAVGVSIGKGLPGAIARLMPFKGRFKRAAEDAIAARILAKIQADPGALDEAEREFVGSFVSEETKKFLRLKSMEARAAEIGAEERSTHLLEPIPDDKKETAEDWMNKFRDDAALVDDELMKEIYARILLREDRVPGAVSLRTLAVLRYMDRQIAEAFGRLQKIVINGLLVPKQQSGPTKAIHLKHNEFLALGDAGLLNAGAQSALNMNADVIILRLVGHRKLVRITRPAGSTSVVSLVGNSLTTAGKELAKLGEFSPDPDAFQSILSWIQQEVPFGSTVSVTDLLPDQQAQEWSDVSPPHDGPPPDYY